MNGRYKQKTTTNKAQPPRVRNTRSFAVTIIKRTPYAVFRSNGTLPSTICATKDKPLPFISFLLLFIRPISAKHQEVERREKSIHRKTRNSTIFTCFKFSRVQLNPLRCNTILSACLCACVRVFTFVPVASIKPLDSSLHNPASIWARYYHH